MENALIYSEPAAEQISGRATAVARAVSDLMSPAALAVPCISLCVWVSEAAGTYWYGMAYFLLAIPLPLAYVIWLLKSGRVSDFHLPNRRDRRVPFALTIACALAAVALLPWFGAPRDFMAPMVTALLQTLVLFLVTLVWQISIHTSVTTGLVTFAVLALGSEAALLALLVPLVAWARLHLERHNMAQVVAGSLLGLATFGTLFALRGVVW